LAVGVLFVVVSDVQKRWTERRELSFPCSWAFEGGVFGRIPASVGLQIHEIFGVDFKKASIIV
jgi:hypothetical protein